MKYNKNEVMKIVREVLGEDATGVYIHNQVVSKDLDYDDMPLVSRLGESPFIIESTKKYEIHYGLTRLCIYPINKRINWVIKIPITGVYAENYFEDDNDSNVYDGDFYSWEGDNFLGLTQVGTCECDSCDEENIIYEESSYNAKKFMAKNHYIGTYNNIPIYIQEKAIICNSSVAYHKALFGFDSNFLRHEIDYLFDMESEIEEEIFFYNIILNIGVQAAAQVIQEFGELTDLHNQNYGFNFKGIPVLFDYAGYQWGTHYSLIA